MKKFILSALLLVMALTFAPHCSGISASTGQAINPIDTAKLQNSNMLRLEEIRSMDKSGLSLQENQELRKEVREIRKSQPVNNGGIYISVGALILILILLIILL